MNWFCWARRASDHRAILADYSPYFLDQLISIVTASTVVSYALYTLSPDVQSKFPGKRLEIDHSLRLVWDLPLSPPHPPSRPGRKPHAVAIYRPRITFGGAFLGGIRGFDYLSLAIGYQRSAISNKQSALSFQRSAFGFVNRKASNHVRHSLGKGLC